jgi:aldehyde dehydrogenase (NAD+)
VFKPAELAPGCGWALADIISRSGLPEGVFNLVCGSGRTVGNAITEHPDIAGVSFTGSQPVGHMIAMKCVERHAKIQLEMGGKNPLVVLDDADLNTAINCAVNGAFFSTGQRCTASSRFIVTEGVHDRFVEGVIESIRNLKVGNALEPETKIGPVVCEEQLNKNLEYVEIGKSEGATLAWGGERLERETEVYFQAPALFTDTKPDMRINTEEIFGPVASVIRVKDYEEALAVANDTEFGLSTGICTTSLGYARDFQKRADAGMVMINLPTAGVDYHVPFGGKKGSSYGSREQGSYAAEFYTTVKTTYIHS